MAQRVCLNLTMVAMVNSTKPPHLPNGSAVEREDDVKNPVYSWSLDIQGLILSSVFFGMVVVQIPIGYLSGIYPMKRIIGFSMLLSSVLSMLIPPAAQVGAALVIVCRVLQGVAQGTVSTGQHEIWVKWAPPLERGRLTSMTLSGFVMGPFIVLLVSGFICDLLGWPMVFYIFGIFGCILSLCWFLLFYDDPKDHPYMSSCEKAYITSSLPQSARADNLCQSNLSYLLAYICGIVAGQLADFFLSRKIFSVVNVRKLFSTLGILSPVIFIMCLLYLSSSFYSTIIFLTLANSTLTFSFSGQHINALDIAPSYYGFIKAVSALIGMLGGLISSAVAGLILNQDPENAWHKIFFLMSGINVMCLTFYNVFAKGEIQDWAKEAKNTRL
ncbi:Sodium-dependent phosphate transport protein 1 [Lemmus lemmus]